MTHHLCLWPDRRVLVKLALACVFAMSAPAGVVAQEIRGVVRAEFTGVALDGATIVALDQHEREQARSVSDTLGLFALRLPRRGDYRLRVERLGHLPFKSDELSIASGEVVRVEVRLSESAVLLEPIQVVSRRRDPHAPLAGYYDRLDFYGRLGMGRFVTHEQIEARSAVSVEQLLEHGVGLRYELRPTGAGMRRVMVVPRAGSGGCRPAIYIDGIRAMEEWDDLKFLDPSVLEGIEVYRGAAQTPGVFMDATGCGVVLLWTQRGTSGAGYTNRRLTWRRLVAAGGVVALIIGIAAL